MRDIGFTRAEAMVETDRLWELAKVQFALMEGIKSGEIETEGTKFYSHTDMYRDAEKEKIRLLSLWQEIRESGVLPWVHSESGNRLDREPDVWVSRIMTTTYPRPTHESVDVKALRLTFTEESREHSIILTDVDVARKLVTQIEYELERWEEA